MSDSINNRESINNAALIRTLGGISAFSGLLIVLVVELTAPIIEQNRKEAIERAIFEVIPGATVSQLYLFNDNKLTKVDKENSDGERIYAGYNNSNELMGVALEAEGQGYQDTIQVLYGYNPACQCITGMKVLKHAETPGLGDLILKDPAFIANFAALDAKLNEDQSGLQNSIITVKNGKKKNPWEIDSISGATVSSKAIGKMLRLRSEKLLPKLYPQLGSINKLASEKTENNNE